MDIPNGLQDDLKEFAVTAVIPTPGACGREGSDFSLCPAQGLTWIAALRRGKACAQCLYKKRYKQNNTLM